MSPQQQAQWKKRVKQHTQLQENLGVSRACAVAGEATDSEDEAKEELKRTEKQAREDQVCAVCVK